MVDTSFYDNIVDIYDLKGRMGCTDYIDFLTRREVPKNIMKGIDCFNRAFITLKIGFYDLDTGKFRKSGQVFFQRYTNGINWQSATFKNYKQTDDYDGTFMVTDGGMCQEQYQLINDLVSNTTNTKLFQIKEYHRPMVIREGSLIATMDYWEDKAARKIQKHWLTCRYNPEYAICKKIVNRQFDEYSEGPHE